MSKARLPLSVVSVACVALAFVSLGCGGKTKHPAPTDAGGTPSDAANGGGNDGATDSATSSHNDAATDSGKAGAGSDAGDGADAAPPGPMISEKSFPAALAKAYCAGIKSCCTTPETDCEASFAASVSSALTAAHNYGNHYYPERAAACIDAVKALSSVKCVTWYASTQPSLAPCNATVDGTVLPGRVCSGPTVCARGLELDSAHGGYVGCGNLGGAATTRCRAYVPTSKLGAACEEGFDGTAATVNVCTAGLVCTAGHCAKAPPCDMTNPTGTCPTNQACLVDACVVVAKETEACSSTIPCAAGLRCDESTLHCVVPAPTPWIMDLGLWTAQYACMP